MRYKLAPVKNVRRLRETFEAVATRSKGVPGIGLVYGSSGAGKTTSTTWLAIKERGVWVRAQASWTPSGMLGEIMRELSSPPLGRCSDMVSYIASRIGPERRPLFIDEVDYMMDSPRMLDVVRDIHDLSEAPVILVGMRNVRMRITNRLQLARRISEEVEFLPLDMEDARIVADECCEVRVADDLVERAVSEGRGSIGLLTVALSHFERFGKVKKLDVVDSAVWGDRPMFMTKAAADRASAAA